MSAARIGLWMSILGAAMSLMGIFGGHYLQDVVGQSNTSGVAALLGIAGGSLIANGVMARYGNPINLLCRIRGHRTDIGLQGCVNCGKDWVP